MKTAPQTVSLKDYNWAFLFICSPSNICNLCTYHGLKNYPPNNYVICVQNSPCKCSFMSFCMTYRGTMVFKKSKEDWNRRHTMDLPYVIRMQKKPQGSFLNTMMANLIFSNPRSDQHRCFSLSVSAPLFPAPTITSPIPEKGGCWW